MSERTPLAEKLRRMIAADGPISVAHYMAYALGDPEYGYYRTRDPFGADGDFVTAPEITQIFGELVGLWAVEVWQRMGAPARAALIELGPGRGTLMADALRAASIVPAFAQAVAVDLVESSPILRARQREALAGRAAAIEWYDDLAEVPAGPSIIVANEFFDALPVFQAVRTEDGWHERMVGLDPQGRLCFGLNPHAIAAFERALPFGLRDAPVGAVYEWRSDAEIGKVLARLCDGGGAALILDYGHIESGIGDTLQGVRNHRFVDPLEAPGEVDITAHVDFAALRRTGESAGVSVHGPLPQGDFLRRLGIEARAARLKKTATQTQAHAVNAALGRLLGEGRTQMGSLFKVIAFSHPALGPLPGFDSPPATPEFQHSNESP